MPRKGFQFIAALSTVLIMSTPTHSMQFTKHENDHRELNAIFAQGEIKSRDAERLSEFVSQLPIRRRMVIYFDSPGGDLFEGLKLGKVIYDKKIKTVIEGNKGTCASACALAFLAGIDRETGKPWRAKSSSSRLGFHSFAATYDPNQSYKGTDMSRAIEEAQRIVFEIIQYLEYIKVDHKFTSVMFKAASHEMNWIDNNDALKLGILVWDEQGRSIVGAKELRDISARGK